MNEFKSKTAFITGGASGLGFGIAKACAAEGMNVVIADLRQEAIDEAVHYFQANNWPVLGIQLNVTDRKEYVKAAEKAEEMFGNIHILINNAGLGCESMTLWDASYTEIDLMIDINLKGVLNGISVILPRMLKHGEEGYVVSTSSMSGLIPTPMYGLYNITKSAVIAMTESLAIDLKDTNVRAAVFCPGPHNTTFGSSTYEIRKLLVPDEPNLSNESKGPLPSRDADNAGRRVLRGIKRNDLYILTHIEPREGFKKRSEAIYRAFPNEIFDQNIYDTYRDVCGNNIYDKQMQVPALE